MRGKARICVATVAFGLGIDKANIFGVVHMYLSASPEHYLQEIGRAGRNGQPARAIALHLRDEVTCRHSLVHSDLISKSQIKALMSTICKLVTSAVENVQVTFDLQSSISVALPLESSVHTCDCKAEAIETILSLIEQSGGEDPLLHVEGQNYDLATIALKKRTLEKLAEQERIAECIKACGECISSPVCDTEGSQKTQDIEQKFPIGFQKQFLAYSFGSYAFSVAQCANKLGSNAEPRHVYGALRRLQSRNELELALESSPRGRALHIKVFPKGIEEFSRGLDDPSIDKLIDQLTEKFRCSVASNASKVLDMHYITEQVAAASRENEGDALASRNGKSSSLNRFQELVNQYFQSDGLSANRDGSEESFLPGSFFKLPSKEIRDVSAAVVSDISILGKNIDSHFEKSLKLGNPTVADYTALSIAKFLHGIETPRTPMRAFSSHPLFRKWRDVNFGLLLDAIQGLVNPGSQSCKGTDAVS